MPVAAEKNPENARQRILETTWKLLQESPDLQVRIADIAAAAGVSRQAVYLHFGNRSNLLLAAARHRDATAEIAKPFVAAARRDLLPGALRGFVTGWFGYVPHIQPVVQLLSAAAKIDPEARIAWEDRMSNVRNLTRVLTGRMAAAGMLREPWTEAAAADWIWHRTHIDGWSHLVDERGWDASEFAHKIADSLERDLLA